MKADTKFLIILAIAMVSAACGSGTTSVDSRAVTIEAENTGPWNLNSDASSLNFVTIKNGSVAEIGTFAAFDGKVTEEGTAAFTIVLDSVFTNNETRDPRMRQYLFETDKHPFLTANTTIDLVGLSDLAVGDGRRTPLNLSVNMHGITYKIEALATVTRIGVNKVLVVNEAPLLIEASDFGLEAGLEKLRELAKLESITPVVPITFSLTFER